MPEVPIMEIPPTMPSLGLKVRRASSSPPGTEIVTSSPPPYSADSSRAIICLGAGLMAGSPTGSPKPGSVTFPTPFPCRKWIPAFPEKATFASMTLRLVTSGSSPASFTTAAVADKPSSCPTDSTGKDNSSPSGMWKLTSAGTSPVSSLINAALAAAVAHAPVV